MKTLGKFPLFILAGLLCGCPDAKPASSPAPEHAEPPEDDPKADLESACFQGDPSACDELGH
jgi:hypothetical protein